MLHLCWMTSQHSPYSWSESEKYSSEFFTHQRILQLICPAAVCHTVICSCGKNILAGPEIKNTVNVTVTTDWEKSAIVPTGGFDVDISNGGKTHINTKLYNMMITAVRSILPRDPRSANRGIAIVSIVCLSVRPSVRTWRWGTVVVGL